jgi:hypothetical protein
MKRTIGILGLCLAVLAWANMAAAQSSAAREAALILRILSYDGALKSRAGGGQVTVLVVYERGNGTSKSERSRIVQAVNSIGQRTTVQNMQARAVDHAYSDPGSLIGAARSTGAAAIYVCSGLENKASKIANAARRADLLSFSPVERNVRNAGLSVGLIEGGSRIRLLINLGAVRSEGARLDAAVLRLAEVIR